MKTPEQIKAAIARYEKDLKAIRSGIEDVEVWKDASRCMKNEQLFIQQREELQDLRKKEADMDFKIRFAKWVLEED